MLRGGCGGGSDRRWDACRDGEIKSEWSLEQTTTTIPIIGTSPCNNANSTYKHRPQQPANSTSSSPAAPTTFTPPGGSCCTAAVSGTTGAVAGS